MYVNTGYIEYTPCLEKGGMCTVKSGCGLHTCDTTLNYGGSERNTNNTAQPLTVKPVCPDDCHFLNRPLYNLAHQDPIDAVRRLHSRNSDPCYGRRSRRGGEPTRHGLTPEEALIAASKRLEARDQDSLKLVPSSSHNAKIRVRNCELRHPV
jgi:hypothetical protein